MKKHFSALTVVLISVVGCAPRIAPTPTTLAPTGAAELAPTPTPVPPTSTAQVKATATPTNAPTATFAAPTASHTVEVTKDVDYVKLLPPGTPVLKLNAYAPSDPGPWPVVVLMHAYFQSKDSAMYTSLADELAGRGAVVFLPQRRSKAATVVEAAEDNGREYREIHESWSCAIRFAREKAADYGGDPGRVTVFGHDFAALETAFMGDDLQALWEEFAARRGGPPLQTECLSDGATARVDAYVAYGGDYEVLEILKEKDPELWDLASPYALIGRNPSLQVHLFHGEQASPTNVERAVEYREALGDSGYDAAFTLLPGEKSQIPWSGPGREALIQAILELAQP